MLDTNIAMIIGFMIMLLCYGFHRLWAWARSKDVPLDRFKYNAEYKKARLEELWDFRANGVYGFPEYVLFWDGISDKRVRVSQAKR